MRKDNRLYEDHNRIDSLNLSSMWDHLIRQTAKYTDSYASDLMIDYECVMKYLREYDGGEKQFIFGMRRFGVDHDKYVFNPDSVRETNRYGKIYQMDVKPYVNEDGYRWEGYVQVELWEISYTYDEIYNNMEATFA